jgi:hypothetical protein
VPAEVHLLRANIDVLKLIRIDSDKIKQKAGQIEEFAGLVLRTVKNKPNTFNARDSTGIQDALLTAKQCFCFGLNDACIVFSSIAVECVLNWDTRLQQERKNRNVKGKRAWLDVDNKNLQLAHNKGLPIEKLLYNNEMIADLGTNKPVKFVFLRNKHVHGDYSALGEIHYLSDDSARLQVYRHTKSTTALGQLNNSIGFVNAWAECKPKVVIRQPVKS